MPTFRYESLGGGGGINGSVVDAPDRAAAVRTLRSRGITPVKLEVVAGAAAAEPVSSAVGEAGSVTAPARASAPGRRGGMSRAEMANFVRELATALSAGLPLVQALQTMARSGRSPRQREMLAFLIDQVEHGKPLSDAAEAWGRPWTELTVSLVRAGELSGRLTEVLDQAATLLDRELQLRRAIMGAVMYPAILLLLVCGAVVVVVTFIVPRVLAPLRGQISDADLPFPTRVVQSAASFFGTYWWAILGVAALLAFVLPRLYRQPATRLSVDTALLRMPVLGSLVRDIAVARFTRTLGTLVSAGLPALSALRATTGTLGNKAMEGAVEGVCEDVAGGRTIAEPLEKTGVFPPLLVQIVGLGERSGRLPQLLLQAAGAMERRTEASLRVFTAVLPPVLVVLLALVVGFVVLSIMLPLLQMQDSIR